MAVQELIHKLEVGPGFKYIRRALIVLALVGLAVGYNWRNFRNFSAPEAMDAAQLARNISEGKGFTTYCIRPASIRLLKERAAGGNEAAASADSDPARLKGRHPDLANAPLYPLALAGAMKVLPMHYKHDSTKPFWNSDGRFVRYQPDFLIGLFNQLFLVMTAILIFLLARRMFDKPVAWLATALWIGCEQIWRFSVSGLSTMLLFVIFLGLVWTVVVLDEEVRAPKRGPAFVPLLAALAGLVTGLGGLTRYSVASLIVPVLIFLAIFGGSRRVWLCVLTFTVWAVTLAPWIYRNQSLCGLPFGTATYAPLETTFIFPQFKLLRSLEPNLNVPFLVPVINKLVNNTRNILLNDLLRLGGGWAAAFFLVGLMLTFRHPGIRRLRYLTVGCLGTLVLAQALNRTELSESTAELNSENLIVLVLPLVLIYASSLFFTLLDQITFALAGLRYAAIGLFSLIMCLPMVFSFLGPRPNPVSYPPYYPPAIQQISGWMKENELMMSDIPWGVAWYGDRQCVWITLNAQSDFFAINDFMKPVRALYLTPATMDARYLSEWFRPGERSWGALIMQVLNSHTTPTRFPLRKMPETFLPEQLFLTDWDRWKINPADAASPDAKRDK
ncbi:MAG: hypothetical protein EPO07_18840 [Verrucomicrobia bacterium]|nr:MAG: hypothetical protein EPO07_18840 [Verrucomicrobiota bacterium]